MEQRYIMKRRAILAFMLDRPGVLNKLAPNPRPKGRGFLRVNKLETNKPLVQADTEPRIRLFRRTL